MLLGFVTWSASAEEEQRDAEDIVWEDIMKILTKAACAVGAAALLSATAMTATAETTMLRIQTHYAPETVSGKLATEFVDNVQTMSNGEIEIEMFYSSSVVKSVETFDAAANGFGSGEGCGIVVLKRLSEAKADGDNILIADRPNLFFITHRVKKMDMRTRVTCWVWLAGRILWICRQRISVVF
mgnify:CR=1 FL=1